LITDGEVDPVMDSLRPLWDSLDERAKEVAIFRLEVVQEILTGYKDGHPELARPGEPRPPFGPGFGISVNRQSKAMAAILGQDGQSDAALQRRIRDGEIQSTGFSANTIRSWVRSWQLGGLAALVDGRCVRKGSLWERIDPRYQDAARSVVDTLDGDRSTVSINELDRRIRVRLREDGVTDLVVPQRRTRAFLSWLKAEKGSTTRSQRSHSLRGSSGKKHFPAIRPGQVVAIDATRADNLVFDVFTGEPCSVEILTAIDVATRVVLALRVVPRSADGIDAGLLIYDGLVKITV